MFIPGLSEGGVNMKQGIIKLPPNRVRRNYTGGAGIDRLHGNALCEDTNQPEEWVGSVVSANNPGMEYISEEGQAFVFTGNGRVLFKELLLSEKEFYLGRESLREPGVNMSFLFKILDSSMRLHVQAHPTADFARKYLASPYGKLECYYILSVREGIKPYIRLGFQHAPSKAEWKRIIEEQDIGAMDRCFEKIPIEVGQVWYIPGGMPHAIGEGITMLEIMEPSDLVVRCEFEREGVVVPPEARFMGRGLDFCLDIFDYTQYSADEIREKSMVKPKLLEVTEQYTAEQLVGTGLTSCFEVNRLRINGEMTYHKKPIPQLGVTCNGILRFKADGQELTLKRGDSFFLAAGLSECTIENITDEIAEVCLVF